MKTLLLLLLGLAVLLIVIAKVHPVGKKISLYVVLIIIALIPLALRGVAYKAIGAGPLLRRNLLIYGLGGLVVPFIGIKLIDMAIVALNLA